MLSALDNSPELFDQLLAVKLPPRAHALYLVLVELGSGAIASYARLGRLIGSRQAGHSVGDDETLALAARELVASGLVDRTRMATAHGAQDGPGTPYRWLLPRSHDRLEPAWPQAREAISLFTRHALPDTGAVALTAFSRLAYAADERGHLRLQRRDLGALTGLDPKTATHWLETLEKKGCGVAALAVSKEGRAHIYNLKLTLPQASSSSVWAELGPAVIEPAWYSAPDQPATLAAVRSELWPKVTPLVAAAVARFVKGRRSDAAPLDDAFWLRYFWLPALELQNFCEEQGGHPERLYEAIKETTRRVLGQAEQRPGTFAAYTRVVLRNSLGAKTRSWQTKGETERAASPKVLAGQVREWIRECQDPVSTGDTSAASLAAVRRLFAERFPQAIRRRVAEAFFDGDVQRAEATLTLAIKYGVSDFEAVSVEDYLGIDFLPGWEWPNDLETPKRWEWGKQQSPQLSDADGLGGDQFAEFASLPGATTRAKGASHL